MADLSVGVVSHRTTVYAEVLGFLQRRSGGAVLARVVWFRATGQVDEDFKFPLYERQSHEDDDIPQLVPVQAIKQAVHMRHACRPLECQGVEDSRRGPVVKHDTEENKLYMLWPPVCGV